MPYAGCRSNRNQNNLPALLITHVYHKITGTSAYAHITQSNVFVNVSGFRGISKLSSCRLSDNYLFL
jgi:hypothetical protein